MPLRLRLARLSHQFGPRHRPEGSCRGSFGVRSCLMSAPPVGSPALLAVLSPRSALMGCGAVDMRWCCPDAAYGVEGAEGLAAAVVAVSGNEASCVGRTSAATRTGHERRCKSTLTSSKVVRGRVAAAGTSMASASSGSNVREILSTAGERKAEPSREVVKSLKCNSFSETDVCFSQNARASSGVASPRLTCQVRAGGKDA